MKIELTIGQADELNLLIKKALSKRSIRPKASKGVLVKHLTEMPIGQTLFTYLMPNEITARCARYSKDLDLKVHHVIRIYDQDPPTIEKVTRVKRLR